MHIHASNETTNKANVKKGRLVSLALILMRLDVFVYLTVPGNDFAVDRVFHWYCQQLEAVSIEKL